MKHILKIIFRNIKNRPVNYLINFLGLSLSLSLVFILSVYCYSEFTVDSHHHDKDRIYFLFNELERDSYGAVFPGILNEQISLNIPEVEHTLRIRHSWKQAVFKVKGQEPLNSELTYADESFFSLLNYSCVEGNLEDALKEPMSLVLSVDEAFKLFGTSSAVGETVLLNNKYPFTVRAVIDATRNKSFLKVKAITPISTMKNIPYDYHEGDYSNWGQRNFMLMIKLKDGANQKQVAQKITALYPEDIKKNKQIELMNISGVYLNQCGMDKLLGFFNIQKGHKSQLLVLLTVAVVILIIALLNFINISSSQRLDIFKQTGVQKIIGAGKARIFSGIITETMFIFWGSTFIAIGISVMASPLISSFTGIEINKRLLYSSGFLLIAIAASTITGFLLCIVPSLRYTKYNPLNLIRNVSDSKLNKSVWQRINVTIQFAVAVILITFTMFVYKQIQYGLSTIGFDQENLVAIKINDQLFDKDVVLKEQLLSVPEVKNVSFTRFYPGKIRASINNGELIKKNGEKERIEISWMYTDADVFDVFGLKLADGQIGRMKNSLLQNKVVVNETFIKKHGISEDPLGVRIKFKGKEHEVIGVVKDFHLSSIDIPIIPLMLTNRKQDNRFFSFYSIMKLQVEDAKSLFKVVAKIKSIGKELSPDYPVEISFIDAAVDQMYKSELQFRQIFTLFAGSSIFICCLGIFALSFTDSRRRIKEIGVRKVNGARVREILSMLNKDFIKWVAVAFIIACPVAYYAMNKWLENFAYKTSLSWWIFALAGVLALGIALLTVSWQSWRAATRNPVEALRYE